MTLQQTQSGTETLEPGTPVVTPAGLACEVVRIIPPSAHHPGGVVVAGHRWQEEANGQTARRVPFVQTYSAEALQR